MTTPTKTRWSPPYVTPRERDAARVPQPGDIAELEGAPSSAFARATLRAASQTAVPSSPAPVYLTPAVEERVRGLQTRPQVEQVLQEDLATTPPTPYDVAMRACERRVLAEALEWAGDNRSKAARALQLSREGLRKALLRNGFERA
jgi:DNA-binding protein Fis